MVQSLYYAPCLACWELSGSLVPAMCNRTSCAQVDQLPQSHCIDNREGTFFSPLHIYYAHLVILLLWDLSTLCIVDHLLIRIVTDNPDYKLEELTQNILKRNHPQKIINYSFTKSFQHKNNKEEIKEIITFTRTYNPNQNFNYHSFNNCFNNINNRELCETFWNKKVLLTTRQPKSC